MFNKDTSEKIKAAETIIGPSIQVKGNFIGNGDVIIEGIVEGSIKTSNFLYIGTKSKITAEIEAGEAKISGEVSGNLIIKNYTEITKTAVIKGDIITAEISVEKGATINGHISMKTATQTTNQ